MTKTLESLSHHVAKITANARTSVVAVHGRRGAPSSGIVWNGEGIVVTAAHTLESSGEPEISTADGKTTTRSALVGRDAGTDIAVLRATELSQPAPDWGDTSRLEPGHLAVIVAPNRAALVTLNAIDGEWTTRNGGRLGRYIETDPKRFRGFSGSLLLDGEGKALGMNTMGLARRTPLTVPVETLRRVVEHLLEHGGVRRGFVGITTSPVRVPETVESQDVGLLILSVQPGSPAAEAGLFLGDVVLGVDGNIVKNPTALLGHLTEERIGQDIDVRLLRVGEETNVRVQLGERK